MPTLFRTDQAHIHVAVAGVTIDSVSWDKFEGGNLTVESQMYNPGGMVPAVAMGGKRSRSPATISRVWSDALYAAYVALDNAAGIAAVTCSYQLLAADRQTPVGTTITYTGILGNVTRPGYDSMTSTPAMLAITVDLNEILS